MEALLSFEVPPIRFAPANGARLAWQVWGEGPATIEVAWESELIRQMLSRFGSFSRYLHFDKRVTGASDRRSRMAGIDERVDRLAPAL